MRILGLFLAYLPGRLFYILSDGIAFVLRILVRYRKSVVESNIDLAFPNLSQKEKRRIVKKFYAHFTDVLLETLQLLAFRKGMLERRIRIENTAILEQCKAEGKPVLAVGGHTGNWEWLGTALGKLSGFEVMAAYRPLASANADCMIKKMREQEGTQLIPSTQIYRAILKTTEPVLVYLIADQAPHPNQAYWMDFLGRDTPVFWGPEKIARSKEFVVVYLAMQRVRRGHYSIQLRELKDRGLLDTEGALTEWHVRELERDIRTTPEAWLWSHKRWKHKR
jgi:KDO2-lipid IV(A) lauroyltransferase